MTWARPIATRALVLSYHGVSESWPEPLAVTPAALEEQLRWLAAQGYRSVTFTDAVRAAGEQKLLAITFDDAHQSVVSVALPILSSLRMVATVFVPTAYPPPEDGGRLSWSGIEEWSESPYAHELAAASWDELRGVVQSGWEIGSHGHTHRWLPALSDRDLDMELRVSKEICERETGRECRSLAYPYGGFDDRVIAAARECGYSAAATFPRRNLRSSSAYEWPRIVIYRADDLRGFKRKVSPVLRWLRASPLLALASLRSRRHKRRRGGQVT